MKASAQWLPDRQYQEGPGIRVGDLQLHPGIAVRGGYDNNVFRADGESRQGVTRPKQDAAILAITPHIFLTNETAQRNTQGEDKAASAPRFIGFRAGVAATYLHYFLENAPHNVGADADVFLGIAQGRPVGVDISAGYLRSVPPFTQNAGSRNAFVFNTVDPRLRLKFNSRSRVLSAYVGYAPRYTHYESSFFDYLNNVQHGIELGSSWRFLPSTALIYDGSLQLQDYTRREASDDRLLLYSGNKIVRSRLGINGAVTNNLSVRVMAGYSAGFFDNDQLDEFEDAIGEAVLRYGFGPHSLEVGYLRDVTTSPLGAWYQIDRGFARLGFLIAQRLRLGVEGGIAHANYGRIIRAVDAADDMDGVADGITGMGFNGERHREDIRVDGALRAEYRVTDWLAFMADFTVQSVITDFDFEFVRVGEQLVPDPAGFTAMQVFGGVRAHY